MRVPYRKPGKYSQMKQDPMITPAKFDEIKKKLAHLKKIHPQAAAEVARLAELGDFSENAEYQLAKGRLRGINDSILKLEYQLNHAVLIDSNTNKDKVGVGNIVTVEANNKILTYQILGSAEADPKKGIISQNSPIGSALLGHKKDEMIIVKLASGEKEFKIIKIE